MVDRDKRSTNGDFMNEWRRQAVHHAPEEIEIIEGRNDGK